MQIKNKIRQLFAIILLGVSSFSYSMEQEPGENKNKDIVIISEQNNLVHKKLHRAYKESVEKDDEKNEIRNTFEEFVNNEEHPLRFIVKRYDRDKNEFLYNALNEDEVAQAVDIFSNEHSKLLEDNTDFHLNRHREMLKVNKTEHYLKKIIYEKRTTFNKVANIFAITAACGLAITAASFPTTKYINPGIFVLPLPAYALGIVGYKFIDEKRSLKKAINNIHRILSGEKNLKENAKKRYNKECFGGKNFNNLADPERKFLTDFEKEQSLRHSVVNKLFLAGHMLAFYTLAYGINYGLVKADFLWYKKLLESARECTHAGHKKISETFLWFAKMTRASNGHFAVTTNKQVLHVSPNAVYFNYGQP